MTSPGIYIEAPAKVNLRLKVLAQETSGYHALESVFCAIGLADSLWLAPGRGEVELRVEGGETGPTEDNLVVRAARRFLLETGGVGRGVRIRLLKRIPIAAGLGGGSSDAAATLLALNSLHDHPFDAAALLQMGIELGSDVPFFLGGSPLALGWSRGERLLTLPPLQPRPVLVAHPGERMPTHGAFQRIAELRGGSYQPRSFRFALESLRRWETLAPLAENDFEPVAEEQLPQLAAARAAMLDAGAEIALLAGSGASLFGVFATEEPLAAAEVAIRAAGFATWRTRTLETLPEPERDAGSWVDHIP